VLQTVSVGGMPLEKSSGLETWMSILPLRLPAPAWRSAASEFAPLVQSKTISPKAAASANVQICALPPTERSHSSPASLLAERETHHDLMSSLDEFGTDCAADHAGPEDCDFHNLCSPVSTMIGSGAFMRGYSSCEQRAAVDVNNHAGHKAVAH
jgi:hypothetical protein